MSEVQVEPAREADVPALERLTARAPVHADPPPEPVDWPTVISALGAYVAVLDGAVAGALVAWPHPDHLRVERLSVDPSSRGAGVGGALLDAAELLAIETGTNAVRLVPGGVTPGVLAFAARRGYLAVGPLLEKRLV